MARLSEKTRNILKAVLGGMVPADAARTFGVSRQRVQQIMARAGLSARDTQRRRAAEATANAQEARAARFLAQHSMTEARYSELRAAGYVMAYRNQKGSARARGIEWQFTFAQWIDAWEGSGHLAERGRGLNAYCMARNNDSGPYAPWNVTIKTIQENSSEGFTKLRQKKRTPGVFLLYPGTARPWVARVCGEQLGRFALEGEAERAVLAYRSTHVSRVTTLGGGRGWTYLNRMRSRPYQVQCGGARAYCATQEEAEHTYKLMAARIAAGEDFKAVTEAFRTSRTLEAA